MSESISIEEKIAFVVRRLPQIKKMELLISFDQTFLS